MIQNLVQTKSNLTNNTQKVGARLLMANGAWIPRSKVCSVPSGTARARDLRKTRFGGFKVECKNSKELMRSGTRTFYYRIDPSTVTQDQIQKLFK